MCAGRNEGMLAVRVHWAYDGQPFSWTAGRVCRRVTFDEIGVFSKQALSA